MTEHEFAEWLRSQGPAQAPSDLQRRVLGIPNTPHVTRLGWLPGMVRSSHRGRLLAVATALLIVGGALAVGPGSPFNGRDAQGYTDWSPSTFEIPAEGATVAGLATFRDRYFALGTRPQPFVPADEREAFGAAVAWTSADGESWDLLPDQPSFRGLEIRDVAANDDRIVAVGYSMVGAGAPAVLVSADGQEWSTYRAPASFERIAALPGVFVAALRTIDQSELWTSPDAVTWTKVADSAELGPGWILRLRTLDIDGRSTVVGIGAAEPGSVAALWVADGKATSWRRVADLERGGNVVLTDIAGSNEGLLAVGNELYCCGVRAWTSSDAVAWDLAPRASRESGTWPSRAVATATGFFIIGQHGAEGPSDLRAWATNPDRSWTTVPTGDLDVGPAQFGDFQLAARPDGAVIIVGTTNPGGYAATPLGWVVD